MADSVLTEPEDYLRLERARRYGRSSEKWINTAQLELPFTGTEDNSPAIDVPVIEEDEGQPARSKKKRGRKGLSKTLPRHQIHINLSEEEKAGAINTFYSLVKEELDIVPAQARVIEYLQEKAVFVEESRRVVKAASMPKHPLNKCIASIGLLTYVIVSKFCDGLSLYGLASILKRYGGNVTRTSMANWVIRLSSELQPLIHLMREHQLSYDYLQIDETRVKVLKEKGKSPSADKWMWVAKGGPPHQPVILFEYDPSRGKAVAARLLDGFSGYVQCDALGSYKAICQHEKQLIQVGCFDHARRKFMDAIKASVPSVSQEPSIADIAVSKINALYRLERNTADGSPTEKYQQRQKIAVPLLIDLKQFLDEKLTRVMKGSLTYKALYYTFNQWRYLIRYCEDGRLNISNAGAENAIRPFAVGRRRWLFCDTPRGARASAIHFSLIETAKANGLNPDQYYRHILAKLPYADTVEKYEALLPWNVKANIG